MAQKQQKKKPSRLTKGGSKNSSSERLGKPRNEFLVVAGILALTFIAFIPSFNDGFVNWDDNHYLVENALITSLKWSNIKAIFNTGTVVMGNYHPFTVLSYCIEYNYVKL